ncbi:uncharacterized protein LOC117514531 isoform X2 [Thalassophryne amazonica]|uniref:uncharacterized protein LOC117514531 isoform X2 n=1 Tax=Thalassophryne amazonica TaxID=390379 RepID=UPI001471E956|nr:uncharacterized protein LOC117514531 isoform X2 [Thalassophryne amazonica]
MISFSLFGLCLFSLAQAALGLHPSDHVVVFASLGNSVTLPCGRRPIKSCSSVEWYYADLFAPPTTVTRGGISPRFSLLKDCSLQINHLKLDDARHYICVKSASNSSVSLEVLQITQREASPNCIIELHCSLNTFQGLVQVCIHDGIRINWLTEANTPITGRRFRVEKSNDCFSKLIINKKLTDHYRKWTCQLTQRGKVKVSVGHTTTVKGGLQELFAAVGEPASLPCGNTSFLSVGDAVQWDVGEKPLMGEGQVEGFHVNQDSSLVISNVSRMNSGDYQCLLSTGEMISKIRLHTLDITAEYTSGGGNLTLICVLTCAVTQCDHDFNLTWSGMTHLGQRSNLMSSSNTFISKLFLPAVPLAKNQIFCSVYRDGVLVVSVKWYSDNTLQILAWLALPLGLLICFMAAGFTLYMRRKDNKDAGNESAGIGMSHIHEIAEDVNNDELHCQRQMSTTDSFYDLLQAVN